MGVLKMKNIIIKKLERKYIQDNNYRRDVKIPVPAITNTWGRPLFKIEFIRGPKGAVERGRYFIKEMLLAIPHLEKEGYTAWRKIECKTPAIDLGDTLHSQGTWFHANYCLDHGNLVINIYPPDGAKYLILRNLFTGVGSELRWEP